jgi:hypothetical protein
MRKRVFGILAVPIIAALTAQLAMAAPRNAQKAARAPAPVNHQIRDAFGYAPSAVGSKSCDRFWCYGN